jgi:hypothetical protein
MKMAFDIRSPNELTALAEMLPKIDSHEFKISKQEFIESLTSLVNYFHNPDWMIYQYGAFLPIPCGEINLQLSLPSVIELGVQ